MVLREGERTARDAVKGGGKTTGNIDKKGQAEFVSEEKKPPNFA